MAPGAPSNLLANVYGAPRTVSVVWVDSVPVPSMNEPYHCELPVTIAMLVPLGMCCGLELLTETQRQVRRRLLTRSRHRRCPRPGDTPVSYDVADRRRTVPR